MGSHKSKILIPLKHHEVERLSQETYFNEKEIKVMYKRYWGYCSPDATLSKQQFYNMFNGNQAKGKAIVDHIFRTTDRDDNLSLGKTLVFTF